MPLAVTSGSRVFLAAAPLASVSLVATALLVPARGRLGQKAMRPIAVAGTGPRAVHASHVVPRRPQTTAT